MTMDEGLIGGLQLAIGVLKLRSAQILRENRRLERRNAALTRRLEERRAGQLQQRGAPHGQRWSDGTRAVALPLTCVTALPDETLHEICSLLSVKELGRLACVSPRFSGPCQAGARMAAMRHAPERVRVCAREEGPNWLRVLWRLEYLPTFESCGRQVHIQEHGAVVAWPELPPGTAGSPMVSGWQAAVCGAPMTQGRHYAEFTVECAGHGVVMLGVVGSEFDAEDDTEDTRAAAQRFFDRGNHHRAWVLSTGSGTLNHGARTFDWPGRERWSNVQAGEVVGFELDVDRGTLAVWRRASMLLPLGVLGQGLEGRRVPLGLVTWPGRLEGVAQLKPPLRWAVNVGYCSRLRIQGGLPLQSTAQEAQRQLAEACRWDNEVNS